VSKQVQLVTGREDKHKQGIGKKKDVFRREGLASVHKQRGWVRGGRKGELKGI